MRCLRYILLAISMMAVTQANAAMNTMNGAPEGFEQLDAPRATAITLMYGGEPLGNFAAHTTPTTVQFDQPQTIIDTIPNIRDKSAVFAVLSQPMPANANKLCTAKIVTDCGVLEPEIAGIIYNENRMRGELFFHASVLSVVDTQSDRYLPLPKREFASVYGFTGAVNGVDSQTPAYALTNTSTFSFGEARVNAQTSMTSDGLRFDTAAGTVERNGWSASGGLMQSHPMQLMADRDIAGISIATSRKTVLDTKKTEGNAIILFLKRRSFVSIYREGRLYSSRSYEAGNQQIDTSEMPEGAYDITLKIQEADGTTREEKRFFVKSFDLSPKGEPSYYMQAGVMRAPASQDSTVPELTDHPLVGVGTVRRMTDSTGVSVNLLGIEDRASMEVGGLWVAPGTQAQVTALTSTKGDAGVAGNVVYSNEKFSAAADARRLWMADTPLPGYEDVTGGFTQMSATASYAVNDAITVGVRGGYSQQENAGTTSSIGPYAEWRVWQQGESMLNVSTDAARINGKTQGNIFVNFTYRFGNNGVTSMLGGAFGQQSGGPVGSTRAWHDHQEPGNSYRVGAGISGDKNNRAVNLDGDWRNTVGQFTGGIQKSFGSTSNLTYGGSFAINMAQAADDVRIGGLQGESSAIMVEAAGDAKSDMKIFVNDSEQGIVKVGGKQTIYVSPFHTYKVHLVPVTPGLMDYDSTDKKVTLYPGNVAKLRWDVNRFYVVSATIKHADGTPLVNALLNESREEVTTNEDGRIQAELAKPQQLTFTMPDSAQCAVQLPSTSPINGVLIYREPLTCLPVNQHVAQR